jgi:hypothetical protein
LYAVLVAAAVAAVLAASAPAARADDRHAAATVYYAQLKLYDEQLALNTCLAASPKRNTPCTVRAARRLAAVAGRHVTLIRGVLGEIEVQCVRTVANSEITIQTLWRRGALALVRKERKRAKALFLQAANVQKAQGEIQPRCFADVFNTPP